MSLKLDEITEDEVFGTVQSRGIDGILFFYLAGMALDDIVYRYITGVYRQLEKSVGDATLTEGSISFVRVETLAFTIYASVEYNGSLLKIPHHYINFSIETYNEHVYGTAGDENFTLVLQEESQGILNYSCNSVEEVITGLTDIWDGFITTITTEHTKARLGELVFPNDFDASRIVGFIKALVNERN